MASSPRHLLSTFHEDVPDPLLDGIAKCIWLAYQDADRFCNEMFLREQAHDARGDVRRSMIERNLRNLVQRFPNVTQTQEANETGGSFHTRIRANRLILTQSQAKSPYHLVQDASFRKTYAESSQYNLFNKPERPQEGDLYALILHGPEIRRHDGRRVGGGHRHHSRPAFMTVVFPTHQCKAYVPGARIDLFVRFAALAQAIRNDRTEEIADDLAIQLRRVDRAEEQ
jgi:hypothetical protein